MFSNVLLIIALSENVLSGEHAGPDGHSHAKAPHEILKTAGFANVIATVLLVVSIDGEVALSTDTLDRLRLRFG